MKQLIEVSKVVGKNRGGWAGDKEEEFDPYIGIWNNLSGLWTLVNVLNIIIALQKFQFVLIFVYDGAGCCNILMMTLRMIMLIMMLN